MAKYDASNPPGPPYGYSGYRPDLVGGGDLLRTGDLLKILRRRRGLIALTVLLISGSAALFAFNLTPRYTGVATVMIDPRATRVIASEAILEEQPQDRWTIETQIRLLRSRSFAKRVIDEADLLADSEFNATLPRPPQAPGLVARYMPDLVNEHLPQIKAWLSHPWLVESGLATPAMSQPPATLIPGPSIEAMAIDRLLGSLEVARAGDSYALSIEYSSTDPVKAARIVNKVAEVYVDDQLRAKRAATARATEWLSGRLGELRTRLLEAENAIASYKAEHELIDSRGVTLDSAQLTALHSELISTRAERAQKQSKLGLLRRARQQGRGFESVNEIVSSPVIASLRAQQTELQRQEAQLLQEYGPRHPKILQLNAEKQRLADKIYSEVQNIINAYESEVEFLQRRERALAHSLEQAKGRVAEGHQAEVQLRELEREAEATRDLYKALLERFKKLTEQQQNLEADARVISAAAVPGAPSFPQPKLIVAVGFTSSLMVAGLLALIAESLESGLRSAQQVERALKVSCLGHVPSLRKLKGVKPHQYPTLKPRSAYTEAVRSVHVGLQFANVGQTPQVVLVTSSLPSEGKTTLALSLAASAAASGQKSVIIDVDLRHPSVRPASSQAATAPGLVEFVVGEARLEDVIHQDDLQPNLHVISVRRNTPNPVDLLSSRQMTLLLAQLRSRYRFIVLDAPPILGITDTKIATQLADAVLFVVRWGKTKVEVASNAIEALRDCRAPVAGAVVTQVDMARHAKGAYGDAMQYYGKYKHYYVE